MNMAVAAVVEAEEAEVDMASSTEDRDSAS